MKKVCFVSTIDMPVKTFLLEHLRAMSHRYEVAVAVNTADANFLAASGLNIAVYPIAIERKVSPLRDLRALAQLVSLFRRNRFDVVHSIMPKSGLLSMLAARIARVPHRIHTFTGQVWATHRGLGRWFLRCMDLVLVDCATHILVDSRSQREFLVREGVVSAEKAIVLANGSVCGVNLKRFHADSALGAEVRRDLGIPAGDIVFIFLGRLKLDKGVLDLARAFARLCNNRADVSLLLVGPDEDCLRLKILEACDLHKDKVYFQGYTDAPERYMTAADAICLPSYREGFGIAIIEAAAVGLPAIGTRIYGLADAIVDGVTGFLCQPRDVDALMYLMGRFAEDPELRRSHGERARERAMRDFSSETVVAAQLKFYRSLLQDGD